MKIAMMVRAYMPVPRPKDIVYAPIDLAVDIAKGLQKRGHDVTFFGPEGTQIEGIKIITRGLRPLVSNQDEFAVLDHSTQKLMHYIPALWDRYLVNDMFERAEKGEFDVIHLHHPETGLDIAQWHPDIPVVYTLHDPIYDWYTEIFNMFATPNQYFVSISNNQRLSSPALNYINTIYNGINTTDYTFSKTHQNYLLFAGRIVPQKGIEQAVEVAIKTNNKLKIIGPVYQDDQKYFDEFIKPRLGDNIEYLGYIARSDVIPYYQNAKAFLMPIQWEEPFGVTMIESLSCGTPVVGFRRGSVPEIVADGKTGFVVDTVAEMCEAVNKIDLINRLDCHNYVKEHFSTERMVELYEEAFMKAIQN